MRDCKVERRWLVTHSTLHLGTGETTEGSQEWVTGPCGTPLFSDKARTQGVCNSCASGWECEKNYPTDRGRETIRNLEAS